MTSRRKTDTEAGLRQIATKYLTQSVSLVAAMTLLSLLFVQVWGIPSVMSTPVCITALFQLVACLAYGLVWKSVAVSSPDSLPMVYLAASGLRMLAGVAVMVVYGLLQNELAAIRFFVIIFLIYYFIILIYDTAYFVKVEKKIKRNG